MLSPTEPPFRAPPNAPRWIRDLEAIDGVLHGNPAVTEQLVAAVADALTSKDSSPLSDEQWLRVMLVQQTSLYDDDEMGFQLNDSQTCRAFCQLVDIFIPEATISANLRRFDDMAWRQIEPILRQHMGRVWRPQYSQRVPG